MADLKKALKDYLEGAKRIALLGIGSEFRADDSAGMLVADSVERSLSSVKKKRQIKVFKGGTAPENLTGEIKRFKPTHLIIADTVEMKETPGTIMVLIPEEIGDGVSFTTHKMPARVLIDYFSKSFPCKSVVVGIQPKSVEFGKEISTQVKEAVSIVSKAMSSVLKNAFSG